MPELTKGTEMNYNRYHEILDQLIILNRENREHYLDYRKEFDKTEWARNFCTIQCNIGIRTGKSEYIRQCARAGDLIVVPLQKDRLAFTDAPCQVVSAKKIYQSAGQEVYNTIFVDNFSAVLRTADFNVDVFYRILASCDRDQTFILFDEL